MLNLKDIAARIEQPELRSPGDIDSLKDLINKYPYAQIFPLLYLNQLAKSNAVHFEEELNKYAYRITDRVVLYELIHSTAENVEEATETQTISSIELEPVVEENKEDQITEISDTDNNAFQLTESDPIIVSEQELIGEPNHDIDTEQDSLAKEEPTIELNEEKIIPNQVDDYEKELLAQTLASSYSLEVEEGEKSSDNIDDLLHDIQHKNEDTIPVDEEREANIDRTEDIIEPSEFKHPVSLDAKLTFSSWLRSDSHYIENHPAEKNQESHTQKDIEQLFEGRKEKKEFFSPTKKAKESLDENRVPVSETLAKIFIMQGNYPKAIYAYEQLMLIIPEKKSFFANQIKELKKKLNS